MSKFPECSGQAHVAACFLAPYLALLSSSLIKHLIDHSALAFLLRHITSLMVPTLPS